MTRQHAIVLLAALAAFVALASPGDTAQAPDLKVRVDGSSDEAALVREFVSDANLWMQRLFKTDVSSRRVITVRFGDHLPTASEPLTLHFAHNAPASVVAHSLAQALLQRRALDVQGAAPAPTGSLDWLAAGITSRVFSNSTPVGPARDTATRVPVSPGSRQPLIVKLLRNPVPPELRLPYALYARYCDLLLSVIEARDSEKDLLLNRIFELETAGRDPETAIRLVMTDSFTPEDDFQTWFVREASQMARRARRTLSVDEVAARLQELQTISAVSAEKGVVGSRQITLDQLAENLALYRAERTDVTGLYRNLFNLMRDAPPLLQPALQSYLQAVEALGADKPRTFRRYLAQGRDEFTAAVAKQRKLDAYLDTVERNTLGRSEEEITALFLPLIQESRQRHRALAPELQAFLDALE